MRCRVVAKASRISLQVPNFEFWGSVYIGVYPVQTLTKIGPAILRRLGPAQKLA